MRPEEFMSEVCDEGHHSQCRGHGPYGPCRCLDPTHVNSDPAYMSSPADELRAAVRLLRNPYNCLPGKDKLADLLDAIADEMTERGAVEGSASKAVHPTTLLGLGAPVQSWTVALVVARSQPGIEHEIARSINGTTGDLS